MLLPANGDVGGYSFIFATRYVGLAEIAAVGKKFADLSKLGGGPGDGVSLIV